MNEELKKTHFTVRSICGIIEKQGKIYFVFKKEKIL